MYKFILFLIISIPIFGANSKNVTIVLPWKHQFQFSGYYMAKELGLYKKAGLNVIIEEHTQNRDNIKDVAEQKYEFSIGHSEIFVDILTTHKNIVLMSAIYQTSPLVLLSKKRSDINVLADIKNKTIMMTSTQLDIASIKAMLSLQNISSNDYKVINTKNYNPIDLINSSTDLMVAYNSNEPFFLKEKGIESTIFNPKDYGFDFYSDILYTSKELLQKDPQMVKAFYKASMQGWKYAFDNIDTTIEVILKKYNTQNKTKKALLYEANTLKKLFYIKDVKFGDINSLRIKEIVNTFRLLKVLKSDTNPDFNSFIYKVDTPFNHYIILKEKDEKYLILLEAFEHYKHIFWILIFSLILSVLIAAYFRHKVKSILKEKTEALDKSYKIFDKNISALRTNLSGKIIHVTKAFCDATGYTKEEVIGRNPRVFKPNDSDDKALYKDLWITITSGHTWKGELKNIKKDGTEYWVDVVISPFTDDTDTIVGYEGIRRDITLNKVLAEFNEKLEEEVKERTRELNQLAKTDKLTGLYNRLKIDNELENQINNYTRYANIFSIIILDIDFFKKINDTYGHQVGDKVLIQISKIMTKSVRNTDILGRWGGEEFVIICPNTDEDGAYKLAKNISDNITNYTFEHIGKISISAGLAQIEASIDEESLLNRADKALYKAKKLGRNRVERYVK